MRVLQAVLTAGNVSLFGHEKPQPDRLRKHWTLELLFLSTKHVCVLVQTSRFFFNFFFQTSSLLVIMFSSGQSPCTYVTRYNVRKHKKTFSGSAEAQIEAGLRNFFYLERDVAGEVKKSLANSALRLINVWVRCKTKSFVTYRFLAIDLDSGRCIPAVGGFINNLWLCRTSNIILWLENVINRIAYSLTTITRRQAFCT